MKVLVLLSLAALFAVAVAAGPRHFHEDVKFSGFQKYMQQYQKQYVSLEEVSLRFHNYKASLERIERLNAQNTSASFGLNKFSDLSPAEFKSMYLGYKPTPHKNRHHTKVAHPHVKSIPTSYDWRDKGAVTPVKDQQQCGSCWAFSTTEEIESQWFLKKGELLELSVQQIVSCDTVDQGCNGGDTPTAYQYVESAGGLELDSVYPYTSGAGDSGTCSADASQNKASISGFEYATPGCTDSCDNQNEATLEANLVSHGPVSICVYAEVWQDYTGGVLETGCPHGYSDLDHCVQLVGYNKDGSIPYWLVRNSWGESWGEAGYIYLKQGVNLCGVADEATIAKI